MDGWMERKKGGEMKETCKGRQVWKDSWIIVKIERERWYNYLEIKKGFENTDSKRKKSKERGERHRERERQRDRDRQTDRDR